MEIRPSVSSLLCLLGVLVLLSFSVSVAYAQTPIPLAGEGEVLQYDEAEAHAIDRLIMCPVCPAETIDQAQVPLARQMRQIVREMLSQGATREEILDFFAQRYGQDILASPPKSGFNLLAWIIPLVGVTAALVAGVLVLRSMSVRKPGVPVTVPSAQPVGQDLEPYLAMVDRELFLRHSLPSAEGRSESGTTPSDVEAQREEGRSDG